MARHYDWSPLRRSDDPVPGEPDEIDDAAARLRRTATALQAAYDGIKKVATSDASALGEDSRTIDAFREIADEVADKLIKAKPRYDTAAEALSTYAGELEGAQLESVNALRDAEEAEATQRREEADPPETPLGPFEQSPGEEALDRAIARLERAISARDGAAESAESKIRNRIEDDEVKDSFWDNMSKLADILSNISTVLGVLALVVNCIPVIGQALSAILGIAALLTGLAALILHLGAAIENGEGWDKVVFDAIGVATFGVGRVLSAGAKGAGMASRTLAWGKLSRMSGPVAAQLRGGYAFASKGAMTKGAAAAVARTGPLAGRNPLAVALGPRGMMADLGEAFTTIGRNGWGGAMRNLADTPMNTFVRSQDSLGNVARWLQGEDGVSAALNGIRGLDDFTVPQIKTAQGLADTARTWSAWANGSFGVGVAGTSADTMGVDIPFLK